VKLQFKLEEKTGIVATESKPKKETAQQQIYSLTGFDAYQCPVCKTGIMHAILELPFNRSPVGFWAKSFNKVRLI
jgi:hypothetical protein